jgi:hypothetical protein
MAVFMSKSIAHRYFLPFHIPMLVVLVQGWSQWTYRYKNMVLALVAAIGVSGNFWVYPGKCIGDGTLAYRSYFTIARQVAQQFPADTFYTYAPLAANTRFTTLNQSPYPHTAELYSQSLANVPAVLQSNCNCEFTREQLDSLQQWKGLSFEQGAVYANVLFNPTGSKPIDPTWKMRQPTGVELWMENVKHQLK